MIYTKKSCEEFVDMLAGSDPVPGGGGASALVAAVGIALGNMVGSLTVGKKKYEDVQKEISILKEKASILQRDLLSLVQKDARVFAPLAKAYRMPESNEEEKTEKRKIMEECLRQACSVPYEIMEKCCDAIRICDGFAKKGNRMALSDAGAGAVFCKAALKAASLNVFINTKYMNDRAYAEEVNERAEKMLGEYTAVAENVYKNVESELKG